MLVFFVAPTLTVYLKAIYHYAVEMILAMAIWTGPLLLIIKASCNQMGADKHSLFKLKQEVSEEPF